VILIDGNLLLHAYNPRAIEHERSRAWLETTLTGSTLVRFAWQTLWAFLRISTNPRVFEHPLSTPEAVAIVSSWLAQPVAGVLDPGERHWEIFQALPRDGQTTGPLLMDAAIAALAIEHGATLHSTDRDFARFPGWPGSIRWPIVDGGPTLARRPGAECAYPNRSIARHAAPTPSSPPTSCATSSAR
jgi:toxin-antitoxin system PIN domain toxin